MLLHPSVQHCLDCGSHAFRVQLAPLLLLPASTFITVPAACSGVVMTVDVYHREALADDLLLGRAHVPLAPLLQVGGVSGRVVGWLGGYA